MTCVPLHRIWSNRSTLAFSMCPVDHILVHFGPEESWVGVSLHEAVDFSLDLVEAGWGWILQALLDLLPGAVINVHLQELKGEHYFERRKGT